jgi:hypothetical protein
VIHCNQSLLPHPQSLTEILEDYRRAFPVATYEDYKPLIQRVMAGEVGLLLNEEPMGWAITRGTTKGESKFIPMTPTDLFMRVSAGRAMMNYVASTGRYDLFDGVNLNLNVTAHPPVLVRITIRARGCGWRPPIQQDRQFGPALAGL